MTAKNNPYEGVMFPVKATLLKEGGPGCKINHQVGQSWLLRGLPAGICSFAYQAIFPMYWTLRFGGVDPSEVNPDQIHVKCGRAGCEAQFLIERISDEEASQLQEVANLIKLEDLEKSIPEGLSKQVN